MIWVDPWVSIFAALLLLTVPLGWICAGFAAAAVHELCHILAIYLCGGRVHRIRIAIGGAIIETDELKNPQALLCAMAGPAGSLALLSLCRHFPKLAIAAGIQGLFNLLPLYPLDGGRMLRCVLMFLFPSKAKRIGDWIEGGLLLGLLAVCLVGVIRLSLGLTPVFLVLCLIGKAILRKKPCKPRQIRVQ